VRGVTVGRAPRRLGRRGWPLAAILAGAGALAACGAQAGSEGGPPEPEEEGITLYSGRIAASVGGAIDMWEERVDRDVETRFANSADLAATLIEEGESSPADVFFAEDASALEAVGDRGLLEPLPEEILEQVPPEYRDDEGRWVGVTGRVRAIAYNDELERSELPDSPLELDDPRWEGRVGWAPATNTFQDYVTAVRLELGDEVAREWLEGMVANGAVDYPNNVAIRDAIANGTIDVGLINHYYVAQAKESEGPDYPVEVYFPPEGLGSLALTTAAGVLKSSERKEDALGFVDSLLSDQTQRFFTGSSKEYPLASDVEPDPSLTVPIEEIPVPEGEFTDLSERQATIDLLRETGAL
jgi:iron(III) transport system substrate-binding protein